MPAEWIRSLVKWLPVPVLLILDLFHVKHRIGEVAHALHGEHTDAARSWARVQCDRVEAGKANFHVTGARLMLQGMRWSAEGAGQMAALRADLFNGRWEGRTKELMAA